MTKRKLWIIEFIIIGLLIFLSISVSLQIYNKNIREKNTYYVFFDDVDGLIKGSPVKIQGYQIGYISNIALVNDEAFITFIITEKDFQMPERIIASVAFTGMGGSKSLELFVAPPDSKSKNFITTVEPRRINDFYVYQNQIAQNIVTMTSDFLKMFNEKTTKQIKHFIDNPEIIEKSTQTLDTIQKNETKILNKMEKK